MAKVDALKWRTVSVIQKWYDPDGKIANEIKTGKITVANAKIKYKKNLLGEYVRHAELVPPSVVCDADGAVLLLETQICALALL